MSRSLVLLSLILIPSLAGAQQTPPIDRTDALIANAKRLVAVDADGCLKNGNENEIIVCANFDPNRKHRLPFPELAATSGERKREPIPNGNPEIIQQGRCYITYNERNCFKGVPIFSVLFGGTGGGVKGPAGKLWNSIKQTVPDEDYVKQVQIKANPEQ